MARIASTFTALLRTQDSELIQGLAESIPRGLRLVPRKLLYPDRWLLASALQKCIRRGLHAEVTDVAIALHAVDAEYAWRRLRVIALEDVGMGDVEAVATVMAVAGKRKVRESLGDLRLYVANVQMLAVGLKDRTACDLISWIGCAPEAIDFRTKILEQPARWESLALDDDVPIWQRVVALELLAGVTLRTGGGYRTLTRADPEAVLRVVEALKPHPLVAFAVLRGKGTESLNVALLFAHLLRQAADRCPVIAHEEEVQGSPCIGGLIAPSFCMYTRAGLRALRLFLHRDVEFRAVLSRAGATDAFKALGLLLFQVESGLLDRIEDYAPKVRIDAERAELAQFGMTDDAACAALRMMLKNRLPMLNKARRAAWKTYLVDAKLSGESA